MTQLLRIYICYNSQIFRLQSCLFQVHFGKVVREITAVNARFQDRTATLCNYNGILLKPDPLKTLVGPTPTTERFW